MHKKLIPVLGLLFITNLCFSQVSIGLDYVLNMDKCRRYSKSLTGCAVDLGYHIADRFIISSDFALYNAHGTSQSLYRNWSADLNGEMIIFKRRNLNLLGILGAGIESEKIIPLYNLDPLISHPRLDRRLLLINLGISTKYRIAEGVCIKLNILANSSWQMIVNTGIQFYFNHKET